MAKNIIKEFIIVVLLLLVITLLLGVLFYDYIPMSKVVPIKKEEYKMSIEMEEELGKQVLEDETIIKTYTVEGTELELYKDYDEGKKNPFSVVDKGETPPPTENIIDDTPNINTIK